MNDEMIWTEARVTYPDWSGTAQLDQRMTGPDALLEKVVGLDPMKWQVIGLAFGGGESTHNLKVIAIDRNQVPDDSDVLTKTAEADGGQIPATEFLIHDVDPYALLRKITHVFELRLRRRGTGDLPIRIVALADVPEQD
jgi:hypothetical protein